MKSDKERLSNIFRMAVLMGREQHREINRAATIARNELCDFLSIEFDKDGSIMFICGKEL